MADASSTGISEVRREERATVVALTGEVDLKHSPRIHRTLVELSDERPERMILDLTGVGYMDSSGVGTLVDIYRRVQAYGGRLMLSGMQDKVRSVFEITQLDQFFVMHETVDEALQA